MDELHRISNSLKEFDARLRTVESKRSSILYGREAGQLGDEAPLGYGIQALEY